jgi:prepilin-type N-terminal cleavage/methylation domain-containing protein
MLPLMPTRKCAPSANSHGPCGRGAERLLLHFHVCGGFTLIELLIVVAIIAILAAIAAVNYQLAQDRAVKAADAANFRTIGTALQHYLVDYGTLPPADREAGPFMSHGPEWTEAGNGPASGGSWDGLPWLLYELKYVSDWRMLFTAKYLKLYGAGQTVRGGHPRFHNFRIAYNSSALSSGGHLGGFGNLMNGDVWIIRNLWLPPQSGWFASYYPNYPADYRYPFGEGEYTGRVEHAMFADMAVRTVLGGTSQPVP